MSATKKFWLGVFTFLPFLLFLAYLFLFFTVFIGNIQELEHSTNHDEFPVEFFKTFGLIFTTLLVGGIISLVLMIYYIVHANDNKRNDNTKKIMWTLILIFTAPLGSMVYYFVEIIPKKPELSE